ncbi:MAG: hypothetical protein AAF810_20905 [Cyanobacteria bacterium P01_D01_bin.36]
MKKKDFLLIGCSVMALLVTQWVMQTRSIEPIASLRFPVRPMELLSSPSAEATIREIEFSSAQDWLVAKHYDSRLSGGQYGPLQDIK